MKLFHIRKPVPRATRPPAAMTVRGPGIETYCGEPPTDHDIRSTWQAFSAGDFVPCEECVAVRRRAVSEARRLAGVKGARRATENRRARQAIEGAAVELAPLPQPTTTKPKAAHPWRRARKQKETADGN